MLFGRPQIRNNSNRPEKGGSLRREGKKEGGWGRNFCLPALLSFCLAQSPHTRRPRFAGGRRGRELPRKLYLLFIFFLKISPNFLIEGQPFRKLRFCGRNLPRFCKYASHFLPREPEVRADFLQKHSFLFQIFGVRFANGLVSR